MKDPKGFGRRRTALDPDTPWFITLDGDDPIIIGGKDEG